MSVHSSFYQNPLTSYSEGYANYGSFDEQTDQIRKIISHNDRIHALQEKYKATITHPTLVEAAPDYDEG